MDWRELEATVDATVAEHFGERVRLAFLKNGASDPARPEWTGRGILHSGGDDSYALGTGYRTRLSGGEAELVLDRRYTGPMPVAKDKVRALDRIGTPLWEVKSVSGRYSNLIVLSLTAA